MTDITKDLKLDGFAEVHVQGDLDGYQVRTARDNDSPVNYSGRDPSLVFGGTAGVGAEYIIPVDTLDKRLGIGLYATGAVANGQYRMDNPFNSPNLLYENQALQDQATLDVFKKGIGGRLGVSYYLGEDRDIPVGVAFGVERLWASFSSPGDQLRIDDSNLYSFAEDGDGGWASPLIVRLSVLARLGPLVGGVVVEDWSTSEAMERNVTETDQPFMPAGWDGANFRLGDRIPGRVDPNSNMTLTVGLDLIQVGKMVFADGEEK